MQFLPSASDDDRAGFEALHTVDPDDAELALPPTTPGSGPAARLAVPISFLAVLALGICVMARVFTGAKDEITDMEGKYAQEQGIDYMHFTKSCIPASNLAPQYTGKSIKECAALCDLNPGSKAFEYGVEYGGSKPHFKAGDCVCQNAAYSSSCPGGDFNIDLYVKTSPSFGYKLFKGGCVYGKNLKSYSDKSITECAELCDKEPNSVAFEYGVDYGGSAYKAGDCVCQISADSTNCPGEKYNLDLYVKIKRTTEPPLEDGGSSGGSISGGGSDSANGTRSKGRERPALGPDLEHHAQRQARWEPCA